MTGARQAAADAPGDAVETAIGWMVRLHSGSATPQERQACERWQQERAENAQAWAAVNHFSQQLKSLPRALAHGTLAMAPPPRRRAVLKSALVLGGIGTLGLAASPEGGWPALAADHRTGVGQRERVTLADGSTLDLNTATALDVRLDARERCVSLHRGEVLVACAADRAARPFLVQTAEGTVHATQARFVVRQLAGRTSVQALAGGLEVRPHAPTRDGRATTRLDAGQRWDFDAQGTGPVVAADAGAGAWTDGVLVARDMRLSTLTAELARYRRGWIRCEPAIALLRISGVFPVDDLDRVVAALQRTLPVRARALTPWWVTLGPR